MQGLDKRGISGTAASVMLIFLALAMVGIFALGINRFVSSPNLSPGFSCLDLQLQKHLYLEIACYDSANSEIRAVVKRGLGDFNINSLNFVITFNDSSSESWRCNNGCENCAVLDIGKRKTYYFDVSNLGAPEEISLIADGCNTGRVKINRC